MYWNRPPPLNYGCFQSMGLALSHHPNFRWGFHRDGVSPWLWKTPMKSECLGGSILGRVLLAYCSQAAWGIPQETMRRSHLGLLTYHDLMSTLDWCQSLSPSLVEGLPSKYQMITIWRVPHNKPWLIDPGLTLSTFQSSWSLSLEWFRMVQTILARFQHIRPASSSIDSELLIVILIGYGAFPKWWYPQLAGWFLWTGKPIVRNGWFIGVPLFQETPWLVVWNIFYFPRYWE